MLNRVQNTTDLSPAAEEGGGFDLRDAVNFLWRRWKMIGGVTALFVLIAAMYIARATPLYMASTQLLLDPRKERAAGQDVFVSDVMLDQQMLENQMMIIRSVALLRRVVDKMQLVNDPEFGGSALGGGGAVSILAPIRAFFSKSAEPPAPPAGQNKALSSASLDNMSAETISTIENVRGGLAVARVKEQGLVLTISFTSADPAKAARMANAIADAYVVDKLDARLDSAKRATGWLSDRLAELKQQLRESEEAVNHFRTENNLPQGGIGSATLSQEQLAQLNAKVVSARTEAAEKKSRYEILQRIEAHGANLASLPDSMSGGLLGDLRKQLNDITRQEADLLARYSSNHPSVVNLRAQENDVHRAIRAELQRLSISIRAEYELAKAAQEVVEKSMREVTGQTDLDSEKVVTLRELERSVAVNKALFEDFLQRSKVTQEQSTFEAHDSRVLTPALPPDVPAYPRKFIVILGALVGGLVAGLAGAFAIEALNAGFTSPAQVEEILELPLLASVSKVESRDLMVDGNLLTIPEFPLAKPLSRLSESFRALRSSIQMSDVDHPPKVLQITSVLPSEGKTTIGLTIAASATQSGLRVLLIDADLRHPSASRYFKAEKNVGLVEYLIGEAELQKVMLVDEKLGIWVLPAGGRTQNPMDLLGSERFRALILALREKFDLLIIDTPPLGPVIDPVIVSAVSDKIVFVVRWGSTARELVANTMRRLQGHKKVAGVVFNYVVDAEAQKYGKYVYGNHYGIREYRKYYSE